MIKLAILVPILAALCFYSYKAPRLTSVLIWSFLATIFCSAALLLTVPGEFSGKAITMALLVPLIWVLFQLWCYWDQSKWRVLSGHIALCILSGIIIALTDPII